MMNGKGRAWGVLGGTFDPIHIAHIRLAQHAYNELELEKVIFIPAYIPPHKTGRAITHEKHRLEMTRLAVEGHEGFEVSDMELKLSGASYTARTLTLLSGEHEELVFILGADSFMALDSWYHPEIIFEKAAVACAARDGVSRDSLAAKAEFYRDKYGAKTHILNMADTDVSSTDIREALERGQNPGGLIPGRVYEYILQNGLYQPPQVFQREKNDRI